jgi:hypothetical protein
MKTSSTVYHPSPTSSTHGIAQDKDKWQNKDKMVQNKEKRNCKFWDGVKKVQDMLEEGEKGYKRAQERYGSQVCHH